jgi:hypothetical protein
MKILFKTICQKYNMSFEKLMLARTDMIQGVY